MSTMCAFADIFTTNWTLGDTGLTGLFLWIVGGLAVASALAAVGTLLAYLFGGKRPAVFTAMRVLAFIALFAALSAVELAIHENVEKAENGGYRELWQFVALFAAAALLIGLIQVTGREKPAADTRELTFAAVCLALSFALSYVSIFHLPQGGSVTAASILPLCVYCYYFGFRKGLLAAFVYSLLQLLQDPWIVNPWQVLLDYTVAYSAIALVGAFGLLRKRLGKWGLFVGMICYAILRYGCHVLSGVVYFAEYAGEGATTLEIWIYSLTYNSFVFADLAIAIVVGLLLFSTVAFPRYMDRFVASVRAHRAPAPAAAPVEPAPEQVETAQQTETAPDGSEEQK